MGCFFSGAFSWFVDPCLPGQGQDLGIGGGAETVGIFAPSCTQRVGTFLCNPGGEAVMHVGGCVEPDAGMLVVMVIPIHQSADERPRITQRGEALGERRPVFHGLK